MTNNDKKWLHKYLNNGLVVVKFKKKNGDLRTMICTLQEKLIPGDKLPKGGDFRELSTEVRPCFDVEVGEWRSFRYDSVQEFYEA